MNGVGVIKKLALGLGGVIVLAGFVATYLVATFDPNRYKGELTDYVQSHHERTLSLQGPVTLAIWPRLHVRLEKVALSEHRKPETFASIEALDLAVQVMPLLQGRLRVGQITASGALMHYVRDAQGNSNIDDLIKPNPQDKPPESAGQPLSFDVAGIQLKRVEVAVDDAISGLRGKVVLGEFSSGQLADGLKTDVKLSAQAQLQAPREGQFTVAGQFAVTPDLAKMSARLDKVKLDLVGQLKAVGSIKGSVQADTLQWDGVKRAALAMGLAVDGSGTLGEGASALSVSEAGLTLKQFEYNPAAQTLQLADLDVHAKGSRGGQPLSIQAQWPQLVVKGSELQGSPLKGQLTLGGPVAVEASFSSQPPTGSFSHLKVPGLNTDFKVNMAGQGGQREIAGKVSGDVSVQPEAGRLALDGLSIHARIQEPSLQALALKAQGHVKAASPGAVDWGLKGDINGNAFDTTGQAKLGNGTPSVQALARFASLDLNRWLPAPTNATAASGASAGSGGSAADAPVDLKPLSAINGRFDVSADAMAYRHYRLKSAKVLAQIDQGHLTLQELSGDAWSGHFKASGHAQASGAVDLSANADGVNILALMKDVAGKEVLEGTGQVKLAVSSSGRSVSQLTSGLNGTASVVLRDGAVRGINLAKSLREAKAKLSGGRTDAIQKAQQVEKTDFTEMTASFVIAHGVATNKDLAAKSPFLRIGGAGDIDLPRQRIDYTVNATVTGTIKGQDGAEMDALKGLTVPVKLAGPFDALDWKINWSGVAIGSMQNTLRGKLEDQLKAKLLGGGASSGAASGASAPTIKPEEAVRNKLKDKLKGLFR